MPWHPVEIGGLAEHQAISNTQLWRRRLDLVGVGPKALQRILWWLRAKVTVGLSSHVRPAADAAGP
jgi:hypothetical protein